MITYVEGDLIEAARKGEVSVIAHCCNCFCTMGSGIAPKIKYAFPYAYEADLDTPTGDPNKLGTFSLGEPEEYPNPMVYNLYGQFGYGKRKQGLRDLNYNALYDALVGMANDLHRYDCGDQESHRIGLPMLGAGLAGGNWKIISTMIEETLVTAGHNVVVYIYK